MWLPKRSSYFSVPDNYLKEIFNVISKYPICNILDLGSGRTSIFLKKYCSYTNNLFSIENNKKYYDLLIENYPEIKDNLYLCETITNENESYYINLNSIIQDIKFDLISIDGPYGYGVKHPRTNVIDIINNNQLNDQFFIFLHDTNREGEKWLIQQIFNVLNTNNYSYSYKYLNMDGGAILIYNDIYNNDEIICPVCNNTINKSSLLSQGYKSSICDKYYIIGAGKRNVKCPICHSIDRSRLTYLYFNNLDLKNKNILHIAPEIELSKLFDKANIYECLDLNNEQDKYSSLNVKKMDICNIDYEDNYFDIVICSHVLEHINDEFKSISELYRVLKPNGMLILQVPIAIGLNNTLNNDSSDLDDPSHKRLYGDNYQRIISMYGFKSQKVYLANQYPNYGLNPLEYINIFIKEQ